MKGKVGKISHPSGGFYPAAVSARLPVSRNEFEQVAREAAKESADYETFLLRLMELRFEKYDLVIICDEFGYISFDKQGAELLFNHLSLRAGRKSTIITTNLGFDRWEEIFGDAVLTAALVDRLTHGYSGDAGSSSHLETHTG